MVCAEEFARNGVAVRIGPDYRADAKGSARAAAVFDNDGLTELRTERLEHCTRHDVGCAARGEWNEGANWF